MPVHLVLDGRHDPVDLFAPGELDVRDAITFDVCELLDVDDILARAPSVSSRPAAGGVGSDWIDDWREWTGWNRSSAGNLFLRSGG